MPKRKKIKLIVAGSRQVFSIDLVMYVLNIYGFGDKQIVNKVSQIISGGARGVDKLGEQIGNYYKIPIKCFPADWDNKGKGAGYIRNAEMAKYSDILLAVWDGKSKGTKHMISCMEKLNKKVLLHIIY